MTANVIECAEQRLTEILGPLKESIVRGMLTRVIPNALCRVEFRPVGRKLEDFHVAAVFLEPVIGFLLLVVGGVVLNQIDPMSPAIESGNDDLIQEGQIRLPLKLLFLMQVDETGVVQTYRPKDFLRVAFSTRGNLRLASAPCPRGVQRWCLAERRLVFEDDHRAFGFGVFFRLGYV